MENCTHYHNPSAGLIAKEYCMICDLQQELTRLREALEKIKIKASPLTDTGRTITIRQHNEDLNAILFIIKQSLEGGDGKDNPSKQ